MLDFRELENDIRLELADDSLYFERLVHGGIVNKAAQFTSRKTRQSVLVKYNPTKIAKQMFESERSSLQLLKQTNYVTVPDSFKVFLLPGDKGAIHVLEFVPGLKPLKDFWPQFGKQIGRLHTYNSELLEKSKLYENNVHFKETGLFPTNKFGSDFDHFIGTFTPGRMWRDTWQRYFIGDILQPLVSGLEVMYSDHVLSEKWAWLQHYLPKVFEQESLTPAINHGDLCVANFGQTDKGPVVFDPSVFYGHSQFDLILSFLEESFDEQFFQEYHKIIPRSSCWNDYLLVYTFFYHAVMWYHIDDAKYQSSTHSSADHVKAMLQKRFAVS